MCVYICKSRKVQSKMENQTEIKLVSQLSTSSCINFFFVVVSIKTIQQLRTDAEYKSGLKFSGNNQPLKTNNFFLNFRSVSLCFDLYVCCVCSCILRICWQLLIIKCAHNRFHSSYNCHMNSMDDSV